MNQVESGTVFQFKVPFNLGVAYCKMVDFSSISMYNGILIKVYDYFGQNFPDVNYFKSMPFLMNPIAIAKKPTLRGKYSWTPIGIVHDDLDSVIPAYKEPQHEGFAFETFKAYEEKAWYALLGLQERVGLLSFDKVRHLEEIYLRSTVTIEKRVAMTILRLNGVEVESFFTENSKDDFWRTEFNAQKFIPLYKDIPDPIKGKPLVRGFVPENYINFKW